MHTLTTDNKTIFVFPSIEPETPVIYLNTFACEGQTILEAARVAGYPSFTLVVISDLNWNSVMALWDSPAAFKNGEAFTGGTDDYLRLLAEEITPRVEKELSGPPAWRGDRWVFSGRIVRGICCLPDGCVFLFELYVRLSLVSWIQRVCVLPWAKALVGLHIFLPGGQGSQDSQPGSERYSTEHIRDSCFLSEQGDWHSAPTESRQSLWLCCGTHSCRRLLAPE